MLSCRPRFSNLGEGCKNLRKIGRDRGTDLASAGPVRLGRINDAGAPRAKGFDAMLDRNRKWSDAGLIHKAFVLANFDQP